VLVAIHKKAAIQGSDKTKSGVLLIVQRILEQKGNKPEKLNGEGYMQWYLHFM